MTRSHRGSLFLRCRALSSPSPCRFIPALGLSSSHDNFLYVPLPLRRRVLRHPLQIPWCLPWPSPASYRLGSLHFLLSQKLLRRCRIRFMLRTAHLFYLASTLTSLSDPEVSLPRTLASPWTGLTSASYRELVARTMSYLTSLFAVICVRASGRT